MNQRANYSMRLILISLWLSSCSTTTAEFRQLYDYYFPKHGPNVASSVYRKSFDATVLKPRNKFFSDQERQMYFAARGDPKAFHAFLHDPDREIEGAQGEEWSYECLFLLLRLGDDRFSALLGGEDRATRERAGAAIDYFIDWEKHQFPKTRALYKFRYKPPE